MLELRGGRAGAVLGDGAKKDHHGARRLLIDDLIHLGVVFPERHAVGAGYLADEAGGYAQAVVGKNGVGGDLLLERDFDRADGDGQIGGDIGGDTEAVGHVDDLVNADAGGQLEGGDVARLGEGAHQGHGTLVVVLVVVRGIAAEADRAVDNDVAGLGAVLDGRGVDVGLEAGAGLSLGLGGAIELGERVVAAAHHGQHVAGGVVHDHEGGFGAGVLLQGGAARLALHDGAQVDVDDVARFDQNIPVALAGPGPIFGLEE